MTVKIDGKNAVKKSNMLYRGAGMVSANNSSRLLLDYKLKSPESYKELLECIFSAEGLGVAHLKLEMGSDINSSSGTEPCTMRREDEDADVTRGAGFQLAADAKKIDPDLTLDMLWWSEPLWVTKSADVYDARYKWYKNTLDAAYNTYGLVFDYVSAVRNERDIDTEWIKYLSRRLKAETDCPYDYSAIKISAADEVCTWYLADCMLDDKELLQAVDVVGSHYTSRSTENAQKLAAEYGKKLWFSEASSVVSGSDNSYKYDKTGSGLAEINGFLDIANRFTAMYPQGKMTLCEYQPVVAAYYEGVTYGYKQLITACEPWSGYYRLESGYYMALHFSRFIRKGWNFVDNACYCDGKPGGDGHAITDVVYSYMTAVSPDGSDHTFVAVNTTDKPIEYTLDMENLISASKKLYCWESRGADSGDFDENYFSIRECIEPQKTETGFLAKVTVKPFSMLTVSTVQINERSCADHFPTRESKLLELPYRDDLSHNRVEPLYTTDQGGAFEIVHNGSENVITQMITPDIKAEEWGCTPSPTTNFGDDRWFNYSASANVRFDKNAEKSRCYCGIGVRYILAAKGESGYWLKMYANGDWSLMRNSEAVLSGKTMIVTDLATLKISAVDDTVKCFANGDMLCEYKEKSAVLCAGRAALYSSYHVNSFSELLIEPCGEEYFIRRLDQLDSMFSYNDKWQHTTISGFSNYKRTFSTGGAGAVMQFSFSGSGFALTGENESPAKVSISIDNEDSYINTFASGAREITLFRSGLENTSHDVSITVIEGSLTVDSIEIK